ncbi:hypothetical protein HPB49_009579 [Dermacentor silvarum]|uniref:Uncharacterized protein n=1 Tax=Dermacentor silvarum TaxID=543639 RepID=A0ACB8CWK0_DERSI|nr:hypothetical protein HPB49_009579 [Dermacentor silvarum]
MVPESGSNVANEETIASPAKPASTADLIKREGISCSLCGTDLVTEDQLRAHRCSERPLPRGRGRYACRYCRFACNDRLEHSLHQTQHLKDRPFSCGVCGKAFARNSDRNRHVKIHTGVRPFQCDVCSRKFRQSWHLQYHRSTHTDF